MADLLRPKMCEITLRGFLLVSWVVEGEVVVVQGFVNSQRGSGSCSSLLLLLLWIGLAVKDVDILDVDSGLEKSNNN